MSTKDDNLNQYSEYNKTLRAWLVGFGFGVPALFIINEAAQQKLLASKNAKCIIWLFLIGAAAQILMAFINKIITWCAYHKHDNGVENVGNLVRRISAFENAFWIDVILDIVSLIAFCWSIILIVQLYGA